MADTTPQAVAAPNRASPAAVLAIVAFAVFVAADDLTVVSTMLRPIIGDLGLILPDGLDDAAWIVNVYLIAFVAVMPVAGRLSDVIGRRTTFVFAYALFLVGTTIIPLTDSLSTFLVARVLTALGGGAMVPVALAVVGDVYPEARRARALGTLAAIETLGWVWGPLYGALLVRFLSWRWQFWLNIPLAVAGLAAVWWVLADHDQGPRASRVDWWGAALMTSALVGVNLALLGNAEIQSVTGFEQLTGSTGFDFRWLYVVAVLAAGLFVRHQHLADDPLMDRSLFRGRSLQIALGVNFVVGASLIISMVDVPIFINAVEVDIERSAVVAGWVLSSLTAAMAITSYLGGRLTARSGYRLPIVAGMAAAVVAYLFMGFTWDADTSYVVLALQLGLLGAGLGLVTAPTSAAVVDAAAPEKRGAAAATLMVIRLMGLSVGLSLLTAWGLARFNDLRDDVELPAITDPGFEEALVDAQATLTSQAIAETFLAAALVTGIGLAMAFAMRNRPEQPEPTAVPITPSADVTQPFVGSASSSHASEPVTASADVTQPFVGSASSSHASVPVTASADVTQPFVGSASSSHASEPITASADVTQPFVGSTSSSHASVPQSGAPMSWLQRHSAPIVAALGAFVVLAFVLIAVLFTQLSDTEDRLDQTTEDLARVEAGAALFASQVTGFQDQIVALQPTIAEGLDDAIAGLDEFATSTIEFDVNIDEEVTIETQVVLDRNLQVPINETLPIQESFDTRIEVDTPLGFSVPLDVTVPVDIDVPIELELDIAVNETIPVSATVPVKLDIPIAIEVSGTELAGLAASLAEGLRSLEDIIAGLGG